MVGLETRATITGVGNTPMPPFEPSMDETYIYCPNPACGRQLLAGTTMCRRCWTEITPQERMGEVVDVDEISDTRELYAAGQVEDAHELYGYAEATIAQRAGAAMADLAPAAIIVWVVWRLFGSSWPEGGAGLLWRTAVVGLWGFGIWVWRERDGVAWGKWLFGLGWDGGRRSWMRAALKALSAVTPLCLLVGLGIWANPRRRGLHEDGHEAAVVDVRRFPDDWKAPRWQLVVAAVAIGVVWGALLGVGLEGSLWETWVSGMRLWAGEYLNVFPEY